MHFSINPFRLLGLGIFLVLMELGCQAQVMNSSMPLQLLSSAFASGQTIPVQYTCEGKDISPPLTWRGIPSETKSLALIADDPDAPDPDAPKMTWVHWVLYNIPPAAKVSQKGRLSCHLVP
jgi:phosphatidylethanolamine-binding protein (PEBP) family uncharacterized protein